MTGMMQKGPHRVIDAATQHQHHDDTSEISLYYIVVELQVMAQPLVPDD